MPENGTVTRREARVLFTGQIGSALEPDRLFHNYLDGAVFTPEDFTVREAEEMLRVDGKAKTLEQVLTLPLRGVKGEITPAEGDTGQADALHEALYRDANVGGMSTPFDLVLSQMWSARLFKRAHFEKVFKIEEGRVAYDKIVYLPPASCQVKWDRRTGAFEGIRQYVGSEHPGADETGRVLIRPQRAFVFIHGQHRKPLEGVPDLDTTYQIWKTKQKVRWLWLQFLENQTMPKSIAQHGTQDDAEIQKFAEIVASLKGGGVLGIGPDQNVSPFESSGKGAGEYQAAMRYLDSEMAGSVLAGFTELSSSASEGRGSYALSKNDTDLFMRACQSVVDEGAAAIRAFLLADLTRWNFGIRSPVPRFEFGELVREDAEAALDLLKNLAGGSQANPMIPLEFIDALIVKVAKLLNMDESKVAEAIERRVGDERDPTRKLMKGADAAERIVGEAFPERAAA